MKFFILLFISYLTSSLLAQKPLNIKYDALIYSHDSSTAIVTKGKSSGLFDFSQNEFKVGPNKNIFFNFPQTNLYAEIPVTGGPIWIHWFNYGSHTAVRGNDSSCYIGFGQPGKSNNQVDLNGIRHHLSDIEATDALNAVELNWSQVKIERIHESVFLITCYDGGTRSLDFEDKNRYTYQPGFNRSGVFDIRQKKWLIEPTYKACYQAGNMIFCLRESPVENQHSVEQTNFWPTFNYSYDVYQKGADEMYYLTKDEITETDPQLVQEVMGEGITNPFTTDGIHFVYTNQSKFGLVKIQLFDDAQTPRFVFQPLLSPAYDFIVYSDVYQKALVVDNVISKKITLFHVSSETGSLKLIPIQSGKNALSYFDFDVNSSADKFIQTPDSVFMFFNDSLHLTIASKSDFHGDIAYAHLGIEFQEDSVLIVHHYQPDIPVLTPYQCLLTGEDSVIIDENGMYSSVYPPAKRGFERSGVYSLKTLEWILQPEFVTIAGGKKGYLATFGYAIDNDLSKNFIGVGKWSKDGNEQWTHLAESDFENHPEIYQYAYSGFEADTTFKAAFGFEHHHAIQSEKQAFYMMRNGVLGLYSPGQYFENNWTNASHDFIHYNPTLNFLFYIDQDSIHFSNPSLQGAVSISNGKIIFEQEHTFGDPLSDFRLTLIEKTDTTYVGEFIASYQTKTYASIEIMNGYLIVNDQISQIELIQNKPYLDQGEMIEERHVFQPEISSVWYNYLGNWRKISPYYASIQGTKNKLFIAKSGFYDYALDPYTDQPLEHKVGSRYFLLDSNLRALNYMDFFDFADIQDLGFGLKIKFDDGDKYFFMTYDLKGITNAEWDHFEFENGKLKAILFTEYERDPESGELILNAYGVPTETVSETIRYFSLN
jgi:hypothetical protein